MAAGASSPIHSRCGPSISTSASALIPPEMRSGLPPCEEWASLASTWIRPRRARASIPSRTPLADEKRSGRLDQGAPVDQLADPLDHVAREVAFGVGDQRLEIHPLKAIDGVQQGISEWAGPRLEQDPAAPTE